MSRLLATTSRTLRWCAGGWLSWRVGGAGWGLTCSVQDLMPVELDKDDAPMLNLGSGGGGDDDDDDDDDDDAMSI